MKPAARWLLALAAVGISGVALARLEIEADVTQLLQTPAARALQTAERVFGLGERVVILVEAPAAGREADLLRCGRALVERLEAEEAIASATDGLGTSPDAFVDALLLPYGPLAADPDELEALLSPAGLRGQLEQQLERLSLLGAGQTEAWVERDPLDLHRFLVRRWRSLAAAYTIQPGRRELLDREGKALLVLASGTRGSQEPGAARAVVAAVDAARAAVLAEPWAQGLEVRATGGYHLAEESARVIQRDLIFSLSTSIALAALLLAWGLRLAPWMIGGLMLPTLWGTTVGAGVFALTRSSASAVAFGCTSVLIGLGIDFTIHLATAALAARAQGLDPQAAARDARRRNVGALVLATLTSASAFAAFAAADQGFLREMGWLTLCGLGTCLVGALWLAPPLLARMLRRPPSVAPRGGWLDALAQGAARRRGWVLSLTALLSLAVAALLWIRPPQLEDDLRKIHARNSEPLAVQARVSEVFGGTQDAVFVVLEGASEAEVVAACQRLEGPLASWMRRGLLRARVSIAALIPPLEAQREALAVLARHPRLEAELTEALDDVGFARDAFGDYPARLGAAAEAAPLTPAGLRAAGLSVLVDDLVRVKDGRAYAVVQVFPLTELWAGGARADTAAALRRVLTEAGVEGKLTGLPLVSAEAAEAVAADFLKICALTAGLVLVLLVVRFRHPLHVLCVLAPAALSTLWTAGLFSLTDERLNLMNLGVLPMVLALGIDDGIHLTHRSLAGDGVGTPRFRATLLGVLLTSLTTMLTFGSLALSENRGIASVGRLTLCGIALALLASVTVLPALLALRRGARLNIAPTSRDSAGAGEDVGSDA
ncbi:MAG: MMPL family transporter [Planctomycetes bacterium]|nr:MMPL family transporter [Planctomycetota bacterium]